MKQKHDDYQVVPYTKIQRLLVPFLRSVQRTPTIHGLIEVDVTRARAFLRDHKAKTGESLSFTAFLATCLGKAVDENKSVQACRKGRKHLVLFDDVDVYTPIERDVAGQKQNITYIIRAANRKTFREIHHEIRAAQVEDVAKALEGSSTAMVSIPAGLSDQIFLLGLLVDAWEVSTVGEGNTGGRWASQRLVCLGKGPDGESLQAPQNSI